MPQHIYLRCLIGRPLKRTGVVYRIITYEGRACNPQSNIKSFSMSTEPKKYLCVGGERV